jgi:ubiquinone/menaquinone biosynthesis C-methylase UbiE
VGDSLDMTATSTHASFTGSIPENYDRYLGPLLFEFSAADMARRVAGALDGPAKVLEVACGTGISTRHLANTLPDGTEIIATDLNEAMLDHAATVNGNLPGVTYQQADALELPFDDSEFDAVVCQFGIMFFPDKTKGMTEMTRVLNPGGALALNVWDAVDQNLAVAIVDRVIKSFFESDPPRFLEIPFGLHDVAEVRKLFHGAGYEAVEVAYVSEAVETADHSHVALGFVTGNPTIIEVEQRANISADDIVAAAVQELEKELGPAPTRLDFQEIVFLASKPDR